MQRGGKPPVRSLQPAGRTVAGDPAFASWSPRNMSSPSTQRQEAPLSWVAPPSSLSFLSGKLYTPVRSEHAPDAKSGYRTQIPNGFSTCSWARRATGNKPGTPRRLEGPSWGRPHPDASLDGAGSFKRSRGGGGVRLRGARSGVPVLVCCAVSLAPSHSVSPLPSFPLFFFSFDTKVGL